MTDTEIDKRLALAIGYLPEHVRFCREGIEVARRYGGSPSMFMQPWFLFSHTDWRTIGPIAERYDCFPWATEDGRWFVVAGARRTIIEKTPQRAIALAVIAKLEKV